MNSSNTDTLRQQIYLAALLHDIGKFWQRADECEEPNKSLVIKQHIKANIQNLSNVTQDGYITHAHVLYTQQFLEDNKKLFQNIFSSQNNDENFENLAIYHHKPKTLYQELIQLADWWSSGIDRAKLVDDNLRVQEKDFRKRPLISIFNHVLNTKAQYSYGFNLNPLSLQRDVIFPKQNVEINQSKYLELWKSFYNEFNQLPTNNYKVFADSLTFLLQKYLWCIPASTLKDEIHDSNLYEHSKVSAAIAIALYDYIKYNNIKDTKEIRKDTFPLNLVCIDISGIQSFIYNITMKGAAKALKGRSFYLQLLMDTLINELLNKLDYYRANILYSSGGKAYLILPNINEYNEKIKQYQIKLESWLFDKFNGNLHLSVGWVSFFFDKENKDVAGKNYLIKGERDYCYIGDIWKSAVEKSQELKQKKFINYILERKDFFEPFGAGGAAETCDLTGIEIEKGEKYKIDDFVFSKAVGEQIELGKALKLAKYFVCSAEENSILSKNTLFKIGEKPSALKILDSYWYFYAINETPSSIDNAIIYKVVNDDFDFISNTVKGSSIKGFKFFAGEGIESFSELLDKSTDFTRLSVLVMDVDNLGKLFVNGFRKDDIDNSSFSRLATLSFQLDLFFSGYINRIKEKYKNRLLIVYSGGDDLLAVGNWKEILSFAIDIRDEFRFYVCERDDFSISAGVSLINEKYPISKGVELAKEAEKSAKMWNNEQKGCINFLNKNISWRYDNDELTKVREIKDKFIELFKAGILSFSFIQRFQQFYLLKVSAQGKNLSYRWNTAYFLKRYEKQIANKSNSSFETFLMNINKDLQIFINNTTVDLFVSERNYDLYAIAARWAELELR